jgi:hypothetical protein
MLSGSERKRAFPWGWREVTVEFEGLSVITFSDMMDSAEGQ